MPSVAPSAGSAAGGSPREGSRRPSSDDDGPLAEADGVPEATPISDAEAPRNIFVGGFQALAASLGGKPF